MNCKRKKINIISIIIISCVLTLNSFVFGNNISELLNNKTISYNAEYSFESFIDIVNKASDDIIFKNLINDIEITYKNTENEIKSIFKNNKGNFIKVLYIDGNIVYIDIFKNNQFKDIEINPEKDNVNEVIVPENETISDLKEIISTVSTTKAIATQSIIIKVASNSIISTQSEIHINIEYFDNLYKTYNERVEILNLIDNVETDNFSEIFKNLKTGKYKDLIEVILDNYDDLYVKFNSLNNKKEVDKFIKEIKKSKYSEIYNSYIKFLTDNKINKNIHDKDFQKKIIKEIFYGEREDLLNELETKIFKSNENLINELIQELIDGEYQSETENFVYNFIDITNKYKKNIDKIAYTIENEEEDTSEVETMDTIATISLIFTQSDVINHNSSNSTSITKKIISIIPGILIFILIVGLLIVTLRLRKMVLKKNDNSKETTEEETEEINENEEENS